MNWPSMSAMGLIGLLPQVTAVTYVSSDTAGNVTLTVPTLAASPRKVQEAHVTWGVFKRFLTTFKIDPRVWLTLTGNAYYPKLRDTLTVAGITWTVHKAVDIPANGSPFMLECTYLEIESSLCDVINIRPPVDYTDSYLSPLTVVGDNPALDSLKCRIQFDKEQTEDYQGIQAMISYYKIYVLNLDQNLVLGNTVKATQGAYAGTVFRVLDNANIEDIDELEVLTCRIDPVL